MLCSFRFLYACAVGILVLGGCGGSDDAGSGGNGGGAGTGGSGGAPTTCSIDGDCDDGDECTVDTCTDQGICDFSQAPNGTECSAGSCVFGECQPLETVFPCTEQGIRDAVTVGGGPNGFACDGPQTVTTGAENNIMNNVVLDGLGNLTVDGNETHTVFSVAAGVTAQLSRLGVTRGSAPAGSGGGIRNSGTLTLIESIVTDSSALRFGGGISNLKTMTMVNCTVSGNSAGESGGGVFNSGSLTMMDSTVSGNTASLDGGGVRTTGTPFDMTGCTVSANQAGRNGGGVWSQNIMMITNSTLSGNSASADGGGLRNDTAITMLHVTVSGNTASTGSAIGNAGFVMNMGSSLVEGGCSGTPIGSDGYNIESPANTCGLNNPTDDVGIPVESLRLGPLQDNGGPTMTHALLTEPAVSVAIDQIPQGDCVDGNVPPRPVTSDQRGVARPQGDGCDVGAFELEP